MQYLVLSLAMLPLLVGASCPKEFLGKCSCGEIVFAANAISDRQYVVNCTNTHFTDASVLKHLPMDTEVLIFVGNYLNELPNNIFGQGDDIEHDDLNYIDMSNNHITFIRGKTFHKVPNVETLILNYNDISITGDHDRPRIFSNFESLVNLHLTDAFTDKYNASSYYLLKLQDVFDESYLSQLQKLHLEQNEIWSIGENESIFCPLTNLQHLYLGDNKLSDMDFKIDCMKQLNYIDLRYNMINRLSESAMKRLDNFQSNNQKLRINIKDNPFECDCRAENFLNWLRNTHILLRESQYYTCLNGYPSDNIHKQLDQVTDVSCPMMSNEYSSGTVAFLSFVIVFMSLVILGLVIYHKKRISVLMKPLVDEFTRKIGYSGLANEDPIQEVSV